MRAWRRTRIRLACGRCGHVIEPGQPALALTFARAPETTLWRCVGCCGPAPDDVPEILPAADTRQSLFTRVQSIMRQSFPDWKQRQGNDQ